MPDASFIPARQLRNAFDHAPTEADDLCRATERLRSVEEAARSMVEKAREEVRQVASHIRTEESIAWVYWNLLDVPVSFLEPPWVAGLSPRRKENALRKVASEITSWHFPCQCGDSIPVTTRETLRRFVREGVPDDALCDNCSREAFRSANDPERLARIHEMKLMLYSEYLRTPEWRATRRRTLQRCGNRCQVCNSQAGLEVHHRTYERLGHERDTDVVALCSTCHETYETTGRLTRPSQLPPS